MHVDSEVVFWVIESVDFVFIFILFPLLIWFWRSSVKYKNINAHYSLKITRNACICAIVMFILQYVWHIGVRSDSSENASTYYLLFFNPLTYIIYYIGWLLLQFCQIFRLYYLFESCMFPLSRYQINSLKILYAASMILCISHIMLGLISYTIIDND